MSEIGESGNDTLSHLGNEKQIVLDAYEANLEALKKLDTPSDELTQIADRMRRIIATPLQFLLALRQLKLFLFTPRTVILRKTFFQKDCTLIQ
jgi:hypothetical protein